MFWTSEATLNPLYWGHGQLRAVQAFKYLTTLEYFLRGHILPIFRLRYAVAGRQETFCVAAKGLAKGPPCEYCKDQQLIIDESLNYS